MRFRTILSSISILTLLLLSGPLPTASANGREPKKAPGGEIFTKTDSWVEETLAKMSVSEKVGQMIVASVDAQYKSSSDRDYLLLSRLASEGKIGGIMFLKGDVISAGMFANHLQSVSSVPLLVSADMERGLAMRLDGSTAFSPAMAIAATGNPDLATDMAKVIAGEARAVGIHQNYAPTVDLNINPANPVINTRSFGDRIPLVISMSAAIIESLQSNGIVATAKHFPGHGDVTVDSHLALPVLLGDRQRLDDYELKPFRAAIAQGVMSVMVGHLAVPKLTGTLEPASLSRTIVTDLLRQELGFKGLIVTDALNMKALNDGRSQQEISIKAVEAGNDMLLFPVDPELAHRAVTSAVENGRIPVSGIDDSVRRILLVKHWLGLDRKKLVDLSRLQDHVGSEEGSRIAEKIAWNALTLIRDRDRNLPLHTPLIGPVVDIILNDKPGEDLGNRFAEMLGMDYALIHIRLDPSSRETTFQVAGEMLRTASAVILTTGIQAYSRAVPSKLSSRQIDFVRTLPGRVPKGTPVVFISFGTPYILNAFPEIGTALCAYSENEYSEQAVLRILKGNLVPKGMLPVSLDGGEP
ncbi:MAG TPA: glycoside hydrolase family 3 N-terminal domain-containing protein [Chlorobaculum sp.]|nr:glycoside hydrolase family 3 N-terminal domain-containing protein [Chlorobaculum sp.]